MEFRDAVRARRMVRNYTDEPVDPTLVRELLDLARRAPSAGFAQGQRFVVVTDVGDRRAIAALADEPAWVARGFDPWLSRAPVQVIVAGDEAAYRERYRAPDKLGADAQLVWPAPYWLVDAGASLMVLLLGAVDAGLAAGFLGSHALPGLGGLLGIPEQVHPIGLVTLGHGAPDRTSGSLARGRLPIDEVVRWGRW